MSRREQTMIRLAKARLMNTFRISEEEAQAWLLKTAMDTRRTKMEIVKDLLDMPSLV